MTMKRTGDFDDQSTVMEIDDLEYTYADNSNKLIKVWDQTDKTSGFKDDAEAIADGSDDDADYSYDGYGNMIADTNKGITNIIYNQQNLPVRIDFGAKKLEYLYDALGAMQQKKVTAGSTVTTTDYFEGLQYINGILKFIPTSEGYVRNTVKDGENNYNYVYNFKDHLGSIRLSYGMDPIEGELKIMGENNYYPFGLKHENYNWTEKQYAINSGLDPGDGDISDIRILPTHDEQRDYKYKFNGIEFQNELGLNAYFLKFRTYDPAVGRFWQEDPLANTYPHNSPYAYAENNVTSGTDLEGLELSFELQGDKAVVVSCVKTDSYSLQEIQEMVAQKKVEKDRFMNLILPNDGRTIDMGDITLPQSDLSVMRHEDPWIGVSAGVNDGMMIYGPDAALVGVSELAKLAEVTETVWALNRFARGRVIEQMLNAAQEWASNFPVIDKIEDGIAVSIKSMDLTAASYQEGNTVFNTLTNYIDKLGKFTETTWGGVTIQQGRQFTGKTLELAIQTGKGTTSQWEQIAKAIEYAQSLDINVTIRFID